MPTMVYTFDEFCRLHELPYLQLPGDPERLRTLRDGARIRLAYMAGEQPELIDPPPDPTAKLRIQLRHAEEVVRICEEAFADLNQFIEYGESNGVQWNNRPGREIWGPVPKPEPGESIELACFARLAEVLQRERKALKDLQAAYDSTKAGQAEIEAVEDADATELHVRRAMAAAEKRRQERIAQIKKLASSEV